MTFLERLILEQAVALRSRCAGNSSVSGCGTITERSWHRSRSSTSLKRYCRGITPNIGILIPFTKLSGLYTRHSRRRSFLVRLSQLRIEGMRLRVADTNPFQPQIRYFLSGENGI